MLNHSLRDKKQLVVLNAFVYLKPVLKDEYYTILSSRVMSPKILDIQLHSCDWEH